MLPTTYRGSAVIDGVRHEAEVRLDAARMCLVIADTEVLSWPISGVDVDGKSGGYHVRFDGDEFRFEPSVDDGFGDELHLRRRLGDLPSNGTSATRPPVVAEAPVAGPSTRPERPGFRAKAHARARVQTARSAGVLTGRDLGVRTAIVILSVLALVVVTVAFATGALEFPPSRVVVAGSPGGPPESEPGPSEVSPTVAGVTVTTPPVATTSPNAAPTTVPPTTPTTEPPPPTTLTSAPPTSIVTGPALTTAFSMTGEEFIASWRDRMLGLTPNLVPAEVGVGDAGFGFTSGPFTRVDGSTDEAGIVRRIVLRGDPSGTVRDDRHILTAIGVMIALTEPDLPPEGRRELIEALGLDIGNPNVAELDGALVYRDNQYRLFWDSSERRIVFDIPPADEAGCATGRGRLAAPCGVQSARQTTHG